MITLDPSEGAIQEGDTLFITNTPEIIIKNEDTTEPIIEGENTTESIIEDDYASETTIGDDDMSEITIEDEDAYVTQSFLMQNVEENDPGMHPSVRHTEARYPSLVLPLPTIRPKKRKLPAFVRPSGPMQNPDLASATLPPTDHAIYKIVTGLEEENTYNRLEKWLLKFPFILNAMIGVGIYLNKHKTWPIPNCKAFIWAYVIFSIIFGRLFYPFRLLKDIIFNHCCT